MTKDLENFDARELADEMLAFYDGELPEVALDERALLDPAAILDEARKHHPRNIAETIDLSFTD